MTAILEEARDVIMEATEMEGAGVTMPGSLALAIRVREFLTPGLLVADYESPEVPYVSLPSLSVLIEGPADAGVYASIKRRLNALKESGNTATMALTAAYTDNLICPAINSFTLAHECGHLALDEEPAYLAGRLKPANGPGPQEETVAVYRPARL